MKMDEKRVPGEKRTHPPPTQTTPKGGGPTPKRSLHGHLPHNAESVAVFRSYTPEQQTELIDSHFKKSAGNDSKAPCPVCKAPFKDPPSLVQHLNADDCFAQGSTEPGRPPRPQRMTSKDTRRRMKELSVESDGDDEDEEMEALPQDDVDDEFGSSSDSSEWDSDAASVASTVSQASSVTSEPRDKYLYDASDGRICSLRIEQDKIDSFDDIAPDSEEATFLQKQFGYRQTEMDERLAAEVEKQGGEVVDNLVNLLTVQYKELGEKSTYFKKHESVLRDFDINGVRDEVFGLGGVDETVGEGAADFEDDDEEEELDEDIEFLAERARRKREMEGQLAQAEASTARPQAPEPAATAPRKDKKPKKPAHLFLSAAQVKQMNKKYMENRMDLSFCVENNPRYSSEPFRSERPDFDINRTAFSNGLAPGTRSRARKEFEQYMAFCFLKNKTREQLENVPQTCAEYSKWLTTDAHKFSKSSNVRRKRLACSTIIGKLTKVFTCAAMIGYIDPTAKLDPKLQTTFKENWNRYLDRSGRGIRRQFQVPVLAPDVYPLLEPFGYILTPANVQMRALIYLISRRGCRVSELIRDRKRETLQPGLQYDGVQFVKNRDGKTQLHIWVGRQKTKKSMLLTEAHPTYTVLEDENALMCPVLMLILHTYYRDGFVCKEFGQVLDGKFELEPSMMDKNVFTRIDRYGSIEAGQPVFDAYNWLYKIGRENLIPDNLLKFKSFRAGVVFGAARETVLLTGRFSVQAVKDAINSTGQWGAGGKVGIVYAFRQMHDLEALSRTSSLDRQSIKDLETLLANNELPLCFPARRYRDAEDPKVRQYLFENDPILEPKYTAYRAEMDRLDQELKKLKCKFTLEYVAASSGSTAILRYIKAPEALKVQIQEFKQKRHLLIREARTFQMRITPELNAELFRNLQKSDGVQPITLSTVPMKRLDRNAFIQAISESQTQKKMLVFGGALTPDVDSLVCPVRDCEAEFVSAPRYMEHLEAVHPPPAKGKKAKARQPERPAAVFECPNCDRICSDYHKYFEHHNQRHRIFFACGNCGEQFKVNNQRTDLVEARAQRHVRKCGGDLIRWRTAEDFAPKFTDFLRDDCDKCEQILSQELKDQVKERHDVTVHCVCDLPQIQETKKPLVLKSILKVQKLQEGDVVPETEISNQQCRGLLVKLCRSVLFDSLSEDNQLPQCVIEMLDKDYGGQ